MIERRYILICSPHAKINPPLLIFSYFPENHQQNLLIFVKIPENERAMPTIQAIRFANTKKNPHLFSSFFPQLDKPFLLCATDLRLNT